MAVALRLADTTEFARRLDELTDIYADAMRPPPELLPGRTGIMRSHSVCPDFKCLLAEEDDRVVAFTYGFHGEQGQRWHDVVYRAVAERSGRRSAEVWLGDVIELAEIHVRPGYQGKGLGRRLIRGLCEGRSERTIALSTHDADTAARHVYRSMGFTDLLTGFSFPGGDELFVIAAARLPFTK
jgi:ribosomal protein S18 acetylase RimI-like enzyme